MKAATWCADLWQHILVAHGDLPPLSGGHRAKYACISFFCQSFLILIWMLNLVVFSALAVWPQGYMAIGRQVARLISHIIAFRIYYKRGTKSFRNQSLYIIKKTTYEKNLRISFSCYNSIFIFKIPMCIRSLCNKHFYAWSKLGATTNTLQARQTFNIELKPNQTFNLSSFFIIHLIDQWTLFTHTHTHTHTHSRYHFKPLHWN